jgi:hypothetical protein
MAGQKEYLIRFAFDCRNGSVKLKTPSKTEAGSAEEQPAKG